MTCTALRQLIVTDAPQGFGEFPSVGGPACLDTHSASAVEGSAYARFLRANGFARGAERTWLDGTRTNVVDVLIYQFRAVSGAVAFARRQWSVVQQEGGVKLEVSGVPGAAGMAATKDRVAAAVVVEHVGPFGVVISCSDIDRDLAIQRAVHYAQDQYLRL